MLMLSSCRDSHQLAASQYTRNQGRTNISAPSQIQIHILLQHVQNCSHNYKYQPSDTVVSSLAPPCWFNIIYNSVHCFLVLCGSFSATQRFRKEGRGRVGGVFCSGRSISLCLVFEDHWCSCNLDPR